jgi:prepilin-type N-terminal cleavage/methylation domain-containing protein/prepilin-type processing-associated H-X9-DG protein
MVATSKRAFTLTEILVVSAIIAVLSGITSVVAIRAVRSGRETQCLNNLKQLEHAWALYESDHDQWSPPLPLSNSPSTLGATAFVEALDPYLKDPRVWFCPLDRWAKTQHMGEWHSHELLSYTVSLEFLVRAQPIFGGLVHVNRSGLSDPASTVMMLDQPELRTQDDGSRVRICAHGRTAMAVYADGHAGSYALTPP